MRVKPGQEPTELKDRHLVFDEPAETPPTDDEFQNTEDIPGQTESLIETNTRGKTKDTSTPENKNIGTSSSHDHSSKRVNTNTIPQPQMNINNEDLKQCLMKAMQSDEFKDAMIKALK